MNFGLIESRDAFEAEWVCEVIALLGDASVCVWLFIGVIESFGPDSERGDMILMIDLVFKFGDLFKKRLLLSMMFYG
jgi:hypothetical protein